MTQYHVHHHSLSGNRTVKVPIFIALMLHHDMHNHRVGYLTCCYDYFQTKDVQNSYYCYKLMYNR